MNPRSCLIVLTLALAGCGKVGQLEPRPGHTLPPKPLLATTTPTAEQLLVPPPSARVTRVDELLTRSQPRHADRFDLPPPSVGTDPQPLASPK